MLVYFPPRHSIDDITNTPVTPSRKAAKAFGGEIGASGIVTHFMSLEWFDRKILNGVYLDKAGKYSAHAIVTYFLMCSSSRMYCVEHAVTCPSFSNRKQGEDKVPVLSVSNL